MSTFSPFHLPAKPVSLIDAINRMAAATGSFRYAMAAGSADYNGHALRLSWNDYRGYYVLEYFYGERVVLHRGVDAVEAAQAAVREFARQGRGATMLANIRSEDAQAVIDSGLLVHGEEPAIDYGWRFAEVPSANTCERYGIPASAFLLHAKDKTDYDYLIQHGRGLDLSSRPLIEGANVPGAVLP